MTLRTAGWAGATCGAAVLISGVAYALAPRINDLAFADLPAAQTIPSRAIEVSVLQAPDLRSADASTPEPLLPKADLTPLPQPKLDAPQPKPTPAKPDDVPQPKPRPAPKPEPEPLPKPQVATEKPKQSAPEEQTKLLTAGGSEEAEKPKAAQAQSSAAYAKAVMKQIRATQKVKGVGKGVAIVGFVIRDDGNLGLVKLLQTSGNPALDQAAVDHIHRAAPFAAPPDGKAQFSFEFIGKG